jgi:hypothetical protein
MPLPTLSEFNFLSLGEQLTIAFNQGTFLATRVDDRLDRISLYHVGSFFVEVYYCPHLNFRHHCRSSTHSGVLDAYLEQLELPALV